MKRVKPVINPSPREMVTLRLMIIIGLLCLFLFLRELLLTDAESLPLYWMLIITIFFTCARILHEWIHYFCITVPPTPKALKTYTVDVFTTFCAGEPYKMIEETLIAIKAIKYPHNTFLCDEADDPYLRDLCNKLDVIHVTRIDKTNAKAGNINNALKRSTAELCVVLDPDHVPFPDFLDPIVSHFNDPKVGFVQIVQSYKNHDQNLIAKGAAQQTFQFYGPIMMTMNKYGTVLAIGANCTFRRTALDSIGGHAAGLAEDMHTAMQLHAQGWKSVYVPAVLARGLVPSTLSAYYSQQLKWSRGVFELLVTSYVKLFRKFTWQQKLHYGTIPIYYLSGVIFLINFLIPVLSLLFNTSPINLDLLNFMTLAFPLATSVILIRHFVQKWVMEEEERGFHVVGGLLMIGTWWIFLTGLYYTILRKKVPYIPTPKDDKDDDNGLLNVPNLIIIGISILSIVIGLYNDWNPYNLIMAGFATVNCFILLFTIIASKQGKFRILRQSHPYLDLSMRYVYKFKAGFWILRRRIYSGVRSTALMLTTLIICMSIYFINKRLNTEEKAQLSSYRKNILIPGIFAPQQSGGLSSLKLIKQYEQESKNHFGIISLYLSWGDKEQCHLPLALLDSIYHAGAIPMITWEPWQNLFNSTANSATGDKKVFSNIVNGQYDAYLDRFSKEIRSINRPVFIRFAHEADNPQYPWSATGNNSPEEFKSAWKYVHDYFEKNGAYQVIWVWNPWKPDAIKHYFPGKEYVDWIGVTNLNYGTRNNARQWYSMAELYMPFHRNPIFRSGLPVMLAEMGSIPSEGRQDEWFKNAFKEIEARFSEVKAVVFFNSPSDQNTTDLKTKGPLDWRIHNFSSIGQGLKQANKELLWLANKPIVKDQEIAVNKAGRNTRSDTLISQIRGVNYVKGQNWFTSYHALKKKEIVNDITEMKKIGINTIKYYGPGVYDHNVLSVATDNNINVVYGFWLPDQADFITGLEDLDQFADKTISTVEAFKKNKSILMWNVGNTPFHKFENDHYKPDLFYQREAYLLWLQKLIAAIKAADPERPVSVDVDVNDYLQENASLLRYRIPALDYLGLVPHKEIKSKLESYQLKLPYFYSRIDAPQYLKIAKAKRGVFITNWQDEKTTTSVSFNGLKDYSGQNKFEYYQLGNHWSKLKLPLKMPEVKILLPAITIMENASVTYHALVYNAGSWRLATTNDGLKFNWKLVKNDQFGNPIEVKELSGDHAITLTIPQNYQRYNLYLYVSNSTEVKILTTRLNLPLYH